MECWRMLNLGEILLVILTLTISQCFAQSDGNFLIYNAHTNKCLGDNLQVLVACDPYSVRQQFRWTSENRIFNVAQKKCLGVGSKSVGNKLQWFICDPSSGLQKWECQGYSLFGLKNESLYLSTQQNYLLTMSNNTGDESKWTIHGTLGDVCSQPYEELYTLKGNAFGRPCHFPFRYKNKWYTDCTRDGASSKRLWCAPEMEFESNQLWGYCPTRTTDTLWNKHPLTDTYYQVNEQAALTWYQARKSCQQQGSDLASITEPHEQTFISGSFQKTGLILWTGLNNLEATSGWHWINGQPLRYLKWLDGQPSSVPGHSCGVVSQMYDSGWSTAVCSERHGYVCQKGPVAPTLPPVTPTGFCHSPWIPYSGHCYFLNRAMKTWLEAKDACRRDGGDLLSILNIEEQSFVISQLGYLKTDKLWIGLNDLKTSMLFEWSDHSSVPFVLWKVDEPSHNAILKEDCVAISGEEGKWSDQVCQNKYGYICKKNSNSSPSTNDTVITSPGCKPGWIRYGYYCYLAGSQTGTFEEAQQICEKSGSYLVDITNRMENAFLISLIGARPEKHFWIGLSNQKDRHIFQWTNTNEVLFTHFSAGMPGGKQGCVAMATGIHAGLWDVLNCTNKEKYICKQMAEGVITTSAPPTTAAPNCSEDWYPIKNRDFCYKMFNVENSKKKTWFEALDFCREVGGDLLSIHSASDISRQHIVRYSRTAWIGYSIQDPSVGYVWSDGSSSSFENWEEDEPNNLNNMEHCASLNVRYWMRRDFEWNDLNCEDKQDWLCEIRKGVTPKEVQITEQTYNMTEDGWIIFKDNQYYVSRLSHMEEGRRFCKQHHGDLVVINDETERLFLWYQLKTLHDDGFIGMAVDMDKSVVWMDGSPVVYQAWEKNQPAFLNSEEHCVKMTQRQGLWESVNCGDRLAVLCKRSGSVPVNATVAPTMPTVGGCAPDWIKFQGKCYKIVQDEKNWSDARSYCRNLGGNLASITDHRQQAFLTIKMVENLDLWLGLNRLVSRRFRWTDGSPVHMTKWARESLHDYSEVNNNCVVMRGRQNSEPGKWMTKDCSDTSGFICSRDVDRSVVPTPTEDSKTFFKLGNSSYMVIQSNLTWKEAKLHCESEGAQLASIRDIFTQSYIELQVYKFGQPMWIGLNSMETHDYFMWIDNWQLNMEKWSHKEPKKGRPCVYADVDGEWKTAQCNQTFYSVCKRSTEIAPTLPTQYPGTCPEQNEESSVSWIPFRGHCYSFQTDVDSWGTARRFCRSKGGSLLSIEDTKEEEFIENYISFLGNEGSCFWIGLYKSFIGHWQWADNTVVDYTNWQQTNEDDDDEDLYDDSKCACISARSKQWVKQRCRFRFGPFICKAAKVTQPTMEITYEHKADVEESHHVHAGISVLVVLAVLCVLAGFSYYCYNRMPRSRSTAFTFGNPMYFQTDTSPKEENDAKNLLGHIEISE